MQFVLQSKIAYLPLSAYVLVRNKGAHCVITRPDEQQFLASQFEETDTENKKNEIGTQGRVGIAGKGAVAQMQFEQKRGQEKGRIEKNTRNRLAIYHDTDRAGMPKIRYERRTLHRDEDQNRWVIDKEKLPSIDFTTYRGSSLNDIVTVRFCCLWSHESKQEMKVKAAVKKFAQWFTFRPNRTRTLTPAFTNFAHVVEIQAPRGFHLILPESIATLGD